MKKLIATAPLLLGATITASLLPATTATTATAATAAAAENKKPNIVFILIDDMGYECVGACGGAAYRTPNIDALARDGVRFTHAWAQPLCTPSRVELMTGKYNYKNYVDFGFMNQDQKTFGNLAQMAGYTTAIAGKWQLGANSKLPAHFGFDTYCLWQLNYKNNRKAVRYERYADPLLEEDGKILPDPRDPDAYGPDLFENYVEKFIDANKDKDKPFFLQGLRRFASNLLEISENIFLLDKCACFVLSRLG